MLIFPGGCIIFFIYFLRLCSIFVFVFYRNKTWRWKGKKARRKIEWKENSQSSTANTERCNNISSVCMQKSYYLRKWNQNNRKKIENTKYCMYTDLSRGFAKAHREYGNGFLIYLQWKNVSHFSAISTWGREGGKLHTKDWKKKQIENFVQSFIHLEVKPARKISKCFSFFSFFVGNIEYCCFRGSSLGEFSCICVSLMKDVLMD